MARWDYSYSNFGPKKRISGTTFYKVSIGKDVRWLSMEGIKMLEKAKEAGVTKSLVMKQTSHFTGHGTQVRVKRMRENIRSQLSSLMDLGDPFVVYDSDRVKKGIANMTKLAGLEGLYQEMVTTLNNMTESELRYFWTHNRQLMEKFFTDSDKMKGTPATAAEQDVAGVERNIEKNARQILDKMLDIISRRGTGTL